MSDYGCNILKREDGLYHIEGSDMDAGTGYKTEDDARREFIIHAVEDKGLLSSIINSQLWNFETKVRSDPWFTTHKPETQETVRKLMEKSKTQS